MKGRAAGSHHCWRRMAATRRFGSRLAVGGERGEGNLWEGEAGVRGGDENWSKL